MRRRTLVYAATARCLCGAGLAYRAGTHATEWDCSDILLGQAIPKGEYGSQVHSDTFPFVFYELKSEYTPSAGGASTRHYDEDRNATTDL